MVLRNEVSVVHENGYDICDFCNQRDHRYTPKGWLLHQRNLGVRFMTAKSRYQRRKMRMQARFWRRVFAPVRAFTEGINAGLRIGRTTP